MFKLLKSPKVLVPFIVMLAIITVTMPRNGEFEYHYRKGGKWNYETLVAQFSFPILKTADQIQQEKERLGSTYVPYYKYTSTVYDQVCQSVDLAIGESHPELCSFTCEQLRKYYERGIMSDSQTSLGLEADESQDVVFLQRDKRASKMPKSELYIQNDVRANILEAASAKFPGQNVDSIFEKNSVYAAIVSNLVFDRQTTEMVHQESAEFISPTSGTFRAGDIIVSSGEIITADIAQILDSYKAEFENSVGYNGPNWLLWLGNFFIALILSVLVLSLLFFIREKTFSHFNELLFILTLFVVACIVTFICNRFPTSFVYMIPYPVFALYYKSFFRKRLVLPLYVLCLLPLLIYIQGGAQFFVTFLLSGFIGVFAFEYFNRGWKQFISALIIFASTLFSYITFKIFNGATALITFQDVGFISVGAILCVMAYPLTFLFELIFNLMSANRLDELTDTNRTLLRELADKAPGTFQHSLALMNMADAAAKSIDADVPLIRAAALYHDIGKTLNPMCFIENQAPGVKYHDLLSPKESAVDIIKHVTDGAALCDKHGLPSIIKDFVLSHHGTTTAAYFWTKHINEGGDPADEPLFTYPGPRPRTKEQAILMLCDTLEAASRTLADFSSESVSAFVDDIYSKKFDAGQFDDADITLHELDVVKNTVKNYIVQVHHGRIVYPKMNKQNNK